MDDRTYTFELSGDTVRHLVWIAAGFLFVGVVYLATLEPGNYWQTVSACGIAAGLFCGAYTGFVLRSPLLLWQRLVGFALLAVVAISMTVTWASLSYPNASDTRDFMRFVRISRPAELSQPFLKTLARYHMDGGSGRTTIGKTFLRLYPGLRVGDTFDIPVSYERVPYGTTVIRELSDSAVAVVSTRGFLRGWDSDFRSIENGLDLAQIHLRLTERGITYAYDN